MKKLLLCCFLFFSLAASSQEHINYLENNIDAIIADVPGLSEKVDINIKEASLADFLVAVSDVHKVNISVDPKLKQISIVNSFSDVTVADLLLFLCKEYNLTIDFTGNILSIKPYIEPKAVPVEKVIDVTYDYNNQLLSLDLKDDKLYDAFKRIMDVTGKNLVFAPGMENQLITAYIKEMPIDAALNKLAYANDLILTKTRDNFYLFDRYDSPNSAVSASDKNSSQVRQTRPQRQRRSNFFFNVTDRQRQLLEVDFENTPIASIVYDIGNELEIDMFIASPLENAGNATVKAKNITFDELLIKIFEANQQTAQNRPSGPSQYNDGNSGMAGSQTGANESYSFMKKDGIYFFGTKSQLTVRNVK